MHSKTAISKEKRQARFAWCMYDWGNSGFATVILAAVFPVYFAALLPAEGAFFSVFGYTRSIPAAAFWGYLVALATALVALTAPAFGALADRRRWRRRLFHCLCDSWDRRHDPFRADRCGALRTAGNPLHGRRNRFFPRQHLL